MRKEEAEGKIAYQTLLDLLCQIGEPLRPLLPQIREVFMESLADEDIQETVSQAMQEYFKKAAPLGLPRIAQEFFAGFNG
jgi:hypothetical protein